MSLPFSVNELAPAANIWGPPSSVPESLSFSNIPFAPFSKGDRLGKAADWFNDPLNKDKHSKFKKGQRYQFQAYGASDASQFAADEATAQGDEFEVVDNSKTLLKNNTNNGQATVLKNRRNQQQGTNNNNNHYGAKKTVVAAKKPFGFNNNNRRNWKDDKQERIRESSVKVEDTWKVLNDIELHKLTKLNFEVSKGEDLTVCGSINPYNKKFEKSTGLLKTIDKIFYNPTASEDPVIQNAKESKSAQVFTTDSVISQLMCANRSIYSWDIIVTKKDGIISFDKRENSSIDRVTVDENAQEAPSDLNDSNINNVNNLSLESTFINQNFLANSVIEDQIIPLSKPNPFHDGSSDKLLSKGYKYKKFILKNSQDDENPTSIIIRTEFDSKDPSTNQTLSIKAVNEYANTGIDWKTKFNSQRGAIIAAQLKNNNNKFAKWANQAILADVDQIKLGFVSRVNFKDNNNHTILGVASYKPSDLASQINLSIGNGWGIVKSFIDIIGAEDDGKFVILKNPNAPKITLYRVPSNSFQEE